MKTLLFSLLAASAASAQPDPAPRPLTLPEAQAIALKNHPAVSAALLNALAAGQVTAEVRSAYFPTLTASVTAAGAADGSRIAAGALNNPIIYNRIASGFTVSQLLTDFGRTANLTESAKLRAKAQQDNAQTTRAQVLLQVDRAYFAALRAEKVLEVARQPVSARQVVADLVAALARSKLKSGLDVSFANVNLSEAKLLLVGAENDREAAAAELAAALGYSDRRNFSLADAAPPAADPGDLPALLAGALRDRPELASIRAEQSAAERFVKAERALQYPTVGALASAGVIPGHEDTLRGRYGALGFNVNIPVLNGHLFAARRGEAEYRAQAVAQNARELENRVARDVHIAWLNANTAFRRLTLTAELLAEATQALDLAQTRYDYGLGNIVELSMAQLNVTSAQIADASALYDYQTQRILVDYQTGALH